MSHVTVARVYKTRIAKQHNELLISILLLLFMLPIYLSMCYRYTYIHIWESRGCYWKLMIKLMCYVYSGSRAYPGAWHRMFRYWCTKPTARRTGGSYRMPFSRWYQEGGSQHSPQSLGALRSNRKIELHNIPNTTVNRFTTWSLWVSPLPNVDCLFYSLLCSY